MSRNGFDAVIKARVDKRQKRALNKIARARQLQSSDILREALREYLSDHENGQPKEQLVDA